MKTSSIVLMTLIAGSFGFAVGCGKTESPPKASGASKTPEAGAVALPVALFATAEPANAQLPIEAKKKTVKPGEPITLRGRIGGSGTPFVDGRAVFTIVGSGLKSCADNPGDTCKMPWDYCCETKSDIAAHSATIQVVDSGGAPIKTGVKGQHGLKELSEIVVVGKVAQADANVLVVNADSLFVAKP